MINEGLNLYLTEASRQVEKYQRELDELRSDLAVDRFRSRDYRATERLLQIFTELSIGLAKHWVKSFDGGTSNQAYQTFMTLKENGYITSDDLVTWRKIIGMRNGLVHDYLKIDLTVIDGILINRDYKSLTDFCNKAILFLKEQVERE